MWKGLSNLTGQLTQLTQEVIASAQEEDDDDDENDQSNEENEDKESTKNNPKQHDSSISLNGENNQDKLSEILKGQQTQVQQ
jgi:hypothetical protein